MKEKRFANWLRDARDWAVSRNRYWGTPIPLWISDDGEEVSAKIQGLSFQDPGPSQASSLPLHPGSPTSIQGPPPTFRVPHQDTGTPISTQGLSPISTVSHQHPWSHQHPGFLTNIQGLLPTSRVSHQYPRSLTNIQGLPPTSRVPHPDPRFATRIQDQDPGTGSRNSI